MRQIGPASGRNPVADEIRQRKGGEHAAGMSQAEAIMPPVSPITRVQRHASRNTAQRRRSPDHQQDPQPPEATRPQRNGAPNREDHQHHKRDAPRVTRKDPDDPRANARVTNLAVIRPESAIRH